MPHSSDHWGVALLDESCHEQPGGLADAQARVREEAEEGAAERGEQRERRRKGLGQRSVRMRRAKDEAEALEHLREQQSAGAASQVRCEGGGEEAAARGRVEHEALAVLLLRQIDHVPPQMQQHAQHLHRRPRHLERRPLDAPPRIRDEAVTELCRSQHGVDPRLDAEEPPEGAQRREGPLACLRVRATAAAEV